MSRDNLSQFIINNLNSLDPVDSPGFSGDAHADADSRGQHGGQGLKQEDELSIFANTHFFDFDMGRNTDIAVTMDDLLMQQEKLLQNPKGKPHPEEAHAGYHADQAHHLPARHLPKHAASPYTGHDGSAPGSSTGVMPLDFASFRQFSLANELPPHQSPALSAVASPHNGSSPHLGAASIAPQLPNAPGLSLDLNHFDGGSSLSMNGNKRKSVASPSESMESGDRNAAEEDKRRRNTAASARFRIKKKLREQEMERNTRELQEQLQKLETKVMQLEMENRWLKNLVVEKNEARDVSELVNMRNRILGKNGEGGEEAAVVADKS